MKVFWLILIILLIVIIIGWLWVLYSTPTATEEYVKPMSYLTNNSNQSLYVEVIDPDTQSTVLKSQLEMGRKFDIDYGYKPFIIHYEYSPYDLLAQKEEIYYPGGKEILVVDVKDNLHLIVRIVTDNKKSEMKILVKNDKQQAQILVTYNKKTKIIKLFDLDNQQIDKHHSQYQKVTELYGADIMEQLFSGFEDQGLVLDM